MDEKTRQDLIEKLRRKVWGLRGLADLMVHIRDIDEGVDIGERIGELGNTIDELTEGMLDMIDTLEESEMRTSDDRDVTVSDIIEEVKNRICNDYCKYSDEYGPAGFDDMIEDHCGDCPLGRL